ncbi:rubrerythrin [bacterium F16]|nr:rubrerythrin [bacterium F16]
METMHTVNEILDFAIGEEEKSMQFYTNLAQNAEPAMKAVFEGFAVEERGHKQKLQAVKDGATFSPPKSKIQDLRLADYLVDVEASPEMPYEDALIVAMKREKAAFRLYTTLADVSDDEAVRNVLLAIAQEEAKHKLRFEVEYDDSLSHQ